MKLSVDTLARTLLSAIFLISSARHVIGFGVVSGMMAKKGFPVAQVFLALTIVLEIVGGLMLVVNWKSRYAAWALAVFTLAAGSIFHGFWNVWTASPPEFNNELNHFLKNIAIIGGLLLVATSPSDETPIWRQVRPTGRVL